MIDLPKLKLDLNKPEDFGNLAEQIDVSDRRLMAEDLSRLIKLDEESMSPWLSEAKAHLDRAEAEKAYQPQTEEQKGANEGPEPSTEMTLASVIQFSARATGAILGEPDLARASEPGGEALAEWVSSQLRTKDPNWTLDTDPLVAHLAVTGLAWRKRTFDEYDRVFHSHFLPCTDVIINKNVRAIERAPRITHQFERYPYEIERSINRKHWVDYDPQYDEDDPQSPKRFYELDAWLDLDGDTTEEPWTIVISRDDFQEVVKIKPRWSKKTVVSTREVLFFNPIRRFYPYRFLPDLKGGFFPMGFGKLLARVENTADNLLASIVDTAKSEAQNGGVLAGGGFGLPDKVEIQGDRVTTVNTDGRPLNEMFQPFPQKSVSSGSVAILDKLTTLGDRLAGTLNLLDDAPASMSATMAKGIIDNGTQVQSAVHRRLVASMTQEFRMFVQMADAYDMLPDGISASNQDGVAVTADPQLATEMQRSALAGVYMELISQAAEGVPWVMSEIQMRLAVLMRLPNPEALIDTQPRTPQATPKEKGDIMVAMMKAQNDKQKITADAAVKLTQALKNMVEAGGGMIDQRAALLQVAQLEDAVQRMMSDGLGNMASKPGNQDPAQLPSPAPGGDGAIIPEGQSGGPGDAGAGGGAV